MNECFQMYGMENEMNGIHTYTHTHPSIKELSIHTNDDDDEEKKKINY